MEMWCLRRLAAQHDFNLTDAWSEKMRTHPLQRFVFGAAPWAPSFYGVCKVETGTEVSLYMVQESALAGYNDACLMDLKLGYSTYDPLAVKDSAWTKKFAKQWKMSFADAWSSSSSSGVRLAGYKVTDGTGEVRKSDKHDSFWESPSQAFSAFFETSHRLSQEFFIQMRDQLIQYAAPLLDEVTNSLPVSCISVHPNCSG